MYLCYNSSGVTSIDVDLDQVDINQCDASDGVNVGYDPFINTHKCKKETTQVTMLLIPCADSFTYELIFNIIKTKHHITQLKKLMDY